MSLTPEQVRSIAHLARLAISAEEEARYAKSLTSILDFVAALDRADVTGVTAMAHPLDQPQRRRPDAATEPDVRAKAQANAPAVEAGLYLVPKVIE
jgi:aspartyl-tRNA(Asn)/glutamyl-tRNA(Gln) amidotransferase subunit C